MAMKLKRLVILVGCSLVVGTLVYFYSYRPTNGGTRGQDADSKTVRSITYDHYASNRASGSNTFESTRGEGADRPPSSDPSKASSSITSSSSPLNKRPPNETTTKTGQASLSPKQPKSHPNYCLHTFYYMWYANEQDGGRYSHWNHRYIPHWDSHKSRQYPTGAHTPPDDIAANFYPKLGCYNSADPRIMEAHMQQLVEANVGVAVVSWYPRGLSDQPGAPAPDSLIPQLLDIAQRYNIKIAMHIEPYKDRTPLKVRDDLLYFHQKYAHHPAFFKMATRARGNSTLLPVVYVYDSYLSSQVEWANVLSKAGGLSIRGSPMDSIVIGLVVKMADTKAIKFGGFDGFYTYFASDGFSYGSSTRNWPYLSSFAKQSNLIFIPSVGPGYEDTRVRPWNSINTRSRKDGKYYKSMMSKALSSGNSIISITSFNEWHEGTQIEPAIPKQSSSFTYHDYQPSPPEMYLTLTAEISRSFQCTL